jgi:hypothetical protein
MPVLARPLLVCSAAAVLGAGCAHTVDGWPLRSPIGANVGSASPIDVETLVLNTSQMRAITGAGDDLTIIPTMDGKVPVDIDRLGDTAPPQCRWIFAETQTFGADIADFHKTTFQDPPKGGLISEGVAAYRDADTARNQFDHVIHLVGGCGSTDAGPLLVGDWATKSDSLHMGGTGECGRDYRVKSVVLVEVTFCAFPASVSQIVIANILAKMPG